MVPVLVMIAGGVIIATGVLMTIAMAQQFSKAAQPPATRDSMAASILFNLLLAGGDRPDEALRDIRRVAGLGAPVASSVDVASWAETFSRAATIPQREWLLETAVQLVASRRRTVPLAQYSALLDLSFALGFHTDALAKLRERHPFEYIDHAKNARPREADRGGGSVPLFVRVTDDATPLLRTLGIEGTASRQMIISTYRRLAAQHHPDKVFGESEETQSQAAARFIEITRAYEALLAIYRD